MTLATPHWASTSRSPLAVAARRIIWARYDGGPPWHETDTGRGVG